MIKRLLEKILPGTANKKRAAVSNKLKTSGSSPVSRAAATRHEIPASEHGIALELIDNKAIEVCRTLQQAGYSAYIVGGAVRDLLLGLRPKDFDVATNATPEEVKRCFRRAFIIGRRFRIVHVVFGRGLESDVIEVTTFRANVDHSTAHQVSGNERSHKAELHLVSHAVDSNGRVLRDNIWGNQSDDAQRRDFTINAMYFDPSSQILVDYHQGLRDLKARCIRIIGDANERYREDPVRILRAIRFAAKFSHLGFSIEPATAAPLSHCKRLLVDIPPRRMFDEILKLFQTGHAVSSLQTLIDLGLDQNLHPLLDLMVLRGQEGLFQRALIDTDRRIAAGKSVVPSFLLACLFWQDVLALWTLKANAASQERPMPQHLYLQEAISEVFDTFIGDISGRGKIGLDMREIWMMQPRFERRQGKFPHSLCNHPRFRAAWDFLSLRADIGEVADDLVSWWKDFSLADEERRKEMQSELALLSGSSEEKKKRKRRSRKKAVSSFANLGKLDSPPIV